MMWEAKYETGNTQVDNEHKEIFKLVQKLIEVKVENEAENVTATIDFLANYTINHFNHEEELMKESSYPAIDIHKKQHGDFLSQVVALRARVIEEADIEVSIIDIKKVIINWLIDHVLGSDKIMANHYRNWSAK